MKIFTPNALKNYLFESIDSLLENKEKYLSDPQTAFSRTQKISFRDTMMFPIIASNNPTSVEMLDFFPVSRIPSQPAMSYRRSQVKVSAFKDLFFDFTAKLPRHKNFRGMKVIACDGSRFNTPYNPKDTDSFVKCIKGRRGFNQYHLTTCYDILNEVFTDAVIQPYFSMNEKSAFCQMMDHHEGDTNVLFIADRGFPSFNVIAHAIHNGQNFLIRSPIKLAQSIFCDTNDAFDSDSFDIEDTFYIGRSRNKDTKKLTNYHFIRKDRRFDYLPVGDKNINEYQVRLVKFKIPGGDDEYILTNLSREKFPISDLQELYNLRWGIETSFRYLKYAAGLVHMHSIKQEFIFQEIFSKLISYNFCSTIMNQLKTEKGIGLKHKYVIDKTYLIKVCIRFLKGKIKNILKIIKKRKVPVRVGRKFKRNVRRQHADTLQYR